jgi:hypothetical protein
LHQHSFCRLCWGLDILFFIAEINPWQYGV